MKASQKAVVGLFWGCMLAAAGCAKVSSVPPGNYRCEIEAPPAPAAVFAGQWRTNYGPLRLSQAGAAVQGVYHDVITGGNGTLSGTVIGNTLRYHWVEGSWAGDGHFTLCADRASIAGYSFVSGTRYAWSGTLVAGSAPAVEPPSTEPSTTSAQPSPAPGAAEPSVEDIQKALQQVQ